MSPVDRLARLDRFRDSLSQGDRGRLDKAFPRSIDGGIAKCDTTVGSQTSCEAAANRPALRSTGLMAKFRVFEKQGTADTGFPNSRGEGSYCIGNDHCERTATVLLTQYTGWGICVEVEKISGTGRG